MNFSEMLEIFYFKIAKKNIMSYPKLISNQVH